MGLSTSACFELCYHNFGWHMFCWPHGAISTTDLSILFEDIYSILLLLYCQTIVAFKCKLYMIVSTKNSVRLQKIFCVTVLVCINASFFLWGYLKGSLETIQESWVGSRPSGDVVNIFIILTVKNDIFFISFHTPI